MKFSRKLVVDGSLLMFHLNAHRTHVIIREKSKKFTVIQRRGQGVVSVQKKKKAITERQNALGTTKPSGGLWVSRTKLLHREFFPLFSSNFFSSLFDALQLKRKKGWFVCISVADDVNSARHTTNCKRKSHRVGHFPFILIHSVVLRYNFARVNALLGFRSFSLFSFARRALCADCMSTKLIDESCILSGAYCRLRMRRVVITDNSATCICSIIRTAHPPEVSCSIIVYRFFRRHFCSCISLLVLSADSTFCMLRQRSKHIFTYFACLYIWIFVVA